MNSGILSLLYLILTLTSVILSLNKSYDGLIIILCNIFFILLYFPYFNLTILAYVILFIGEISLLRKYDMFFYIDYKITITITNHYLLFNCIIVFINMIWLLYNKIKYFR